MSDATRCRCYGCPVTDGRAKIRRCIVCDRCNHRHGDELQAIVVDLVRRGEMDPGHGLALMLLDDAHSAGMLIVIADAADPRTASLWIERPVPRWRVLVGRRSLAEQPCDVREVVDLAILPCWGLRATPEVLARMRADIVEALTFLGGLVESLEITPTADVLGPDHLMIKIGARMPDAQLDDAPTIGAEVAAEPEIPDDIMLRPRGRA